MIFLKMPKSQFWIFRETPGFRRAPSHIVSVNLVGMSSEGIGLHWPSTHNSLNDSLSQLLLVPIQWMMLLPTMFSNSWNLLINSLTRFLMFLDYLCSNLLVCLFIYIITTGQRILYTMDDSVYKCNRNNLPDLN